MERQARRAELEAINSDCKIGLLRVFCPSGVAWLHTLPLTVLVSLVNLHTLVISIRGELVRPPASIESGVLPP